MTLSDKIKLALKNGQFPVSLEVEPSKETLIFYGKGDLSGVVNLLSWTLQDAEINYDDPRRNTNDLRCVVERDGDNSVKSTITLTRLTKAAYNKIINSATDTDGDGKAELPEAPDTDGDGVADDIAELNTTPPDCEVCENTGSVESKPIEDLKAGEKMEYTPCTDCPRGAELNDDDKPDTVA